MSSSAGIITARFVIPNGGKEIKLYFSPNTQIPNTTWKIDFGDGNGYIAGNPNPVKTYANNTGNDIEIEVKFQITSGAMSGVQIDSNTIGYLKGFTVGNSTLVKNGITYETPDLSWGLNAVFTGDPTSGTGTLLDTTYNVTSLTGFFRNATSLTTVPGHLISGITDLSNLFNGASAFNQYIGNWDTSSVENMSYMFYGAAFNQYIGNWDVSSVTNMNNMFYNNTVFNQNIGYWDTTSVEDMSNMFENASAFNQNISYWNISSVGSDKYVNMFLNSGITDGTYGFTYPTPTANQFNSSLNRFTPETNTELNNAINKWYEIANDGSENAVTTANSVTKTQYDADPSTVKYFGNPNTWDVSGITAMSSVFNRIETNHPDISTWDVSNVTNMNNMFNGSDFNGDISQWNVGNVTNMNNMFYTANAFNQDISQWDVSSVENMANMFYSAVFNQDISQWNVSQVKNMYGMFYGTAVFNQDIGQWNVSQVTNMKEMFYGVTAFNRDISQWNVSKVTTMEWMFGSAAAFNQPIGNWDVSSVETMANMFYGYFDNQDFAFISAFNQPIGNWDVSNVTNMSDMFHSAIAFNQDLNRWNVSSVENMSNMFNNAEVFNQNISYWDVSQYKSDGTTLTELTNMFSFSGIDVNNTYGFTYPTPTYEEFSQSRFAPATTVNLQAALNKWYELANTDNGDGTYTDTSSTANSVTEAQYDADQSTVKYYGNPNTWDVRGPEGNRITDMSSLFQNITNISNYNVHPDISTWDVSNVTNMTSMFSGSTFNQDISQWNVSIVENMSTMFYNVTAFNQDISQWNVSQVKFMSSMFNGVTAFNQDISQWNVSKVTAMEGMFNGATAFNGDISQWNVSIVENMSFMFHGAAAFNHYIGQWNVSQVKSMSSMFRGATAFNRDINTKTVTAEDSPTGEAYTAWDTSSVEDMSYMFYDNTDFNQDIRNWDTSSVGDMSYMFENASVFNQNISYWNTSSVGSDKYVNMFLNSGIGSDNTYGFTYPTPTSNEFNQIRPPFTPATTDALQAALNKWYELANTDNGDGTYTDTSSTANSVTELDYNGNPITVKYFGNPNTWDVSGITNMSYLFQNKTQTNHPDISTWNVSSVNYMTNMFNNAAAFNGDISQWSVSSVKDMSYMFQYAVAFNQDIGKWNVSIVEDMSNMFENARAFNQDINTKEVTVNGTTYTAWNVSSVTDMSYMFNGASVFNQNISIWNTTITDESGKYNNMFSYSGITNGLYGFTVPTPLSTQFNQDIGLNGYNPVTIERGDTYTDAGAVAASDVTLTTTTNQVNTSVADTYSVTYNGTKGDQTVTRIRTVIVEDTTPPVITSSNLKSSIDDGETNLGSVSAPDESVTWSIGTNDDGAYVQVNNNGVVSLKQPANYLTKQSYTYTIIATDDSNNTNSVNKTVTVIDTTPPVITSSNLKSSINDGETNLGSVSAPDESVTWSIGTNDDGAYVQVNNNGVVSLKQPANYLTKQSYTYTIIATDDSNNTNSVNKTVTVEDTTPPVITSSNLKSSINDGETNLGSVSAPDESVTWSIGTNDDGAYVQVNNNGEVSLIQPANYLTKQSYTYTIIATDDSNNTNSVNKTVTVIDTTLPVITSSNLFPSIDDGGTLLGSVYANVQVRWSIGTNDDGAYVQINSDGEVSLKQPANYQTKQSYTYTIIATDNVGKEDTVTQTVYIEESTPPVITINGDNPATVEKGSTYTDAGATADTGGTVTTSGTVDTNVIGKYTITYSAMHGSSKGTATRTVNVVETMVVGNNVVVELSSNAFIYNSSENATTNDKLDFTKSVFQSLYNSFNQPGKVIKVESIEGGIILPGISEEPIMKPIFLYDGSSKTELTEEEVQDKNIYILTESGQTIKIGTTIITQNSSNYSVTINGVTTTKERGSTFVVGTETFILGSIYIESVIIDSNACACISQSDPLNNAILDDVSASPAKDSTSDSGNSFSILRNAFRRTYYPVQPAKKEIYGDKDASVIVRQRTMNETSRTLNAVGLPMSFTNGNDSNLVRRSVQRTRNSGGVPNKVAKRGPFQ